MRIIQHDARMNAARFANWEQDEQLAAAELGRRLGDDPEGRRRPAPAQLGRLRLADRPLDAAGQRPVHRRRGRAGLHLDRRRPGAGPEPARPAGGAAPPGRLAGPAGVAPRAGPVGLGRGRGRIAGDHRGRRSPSWNGGARRCGKAVEQPRLQDWCAGAGDRPGARGDAAAPLRGGGRPAVPLGLDQAGAAAEGARRALDPSSRTRIRCRARRAARPACIATLRAGFSRSGAGAGAPLDPPCWPRLGWTMRRPCSTSGSAARPGPGSAPAISSRTRRTRRRAWA